MLWKRGGMRHVGLLAAATVLGLAISGCGLGGGPTIDIVFISPTPTVSATPFVPPTPAASSSPAPLTAPPAATPVAASVCSGTSGAGGTKDFWRRASSLITWFDVYCTVVPSGWTPALGQFDNSGSGYVYLKWNGPGGSKLTIHEGTFCTADPAFCSLSGTEVGTALFGDRVGTLATTPGGGFTLIVYQGGARRYQLTSSGINRDTFVSFAAALVKVSKS